MEHSDLQNSGHSDEETSIHIFKKKILKRKRESINPPSESENGSDGNQASRKHSCLKVSQKKKKKTENKALVSDRFNVENTNSRVVALDRNSLKRSAEELSVRPDGWRNSEENLEQTNRDNNAKIDKKKKKIKNIIETDKKECDKKTDRKRKKATQQDVSKLGGKNTSVYDAKKIKKSETHKVEKYKQKNYRDEDYSDKKKRKKEKNLQPAMEKYGDTESRSSMEELSDNEPEQKDHGSEDIPSDGEDGDEGQEKESVDEYAAIKKELSNMSFEEIQQLKETLGTKIYNQVVHGDRPSGGKRKKVFKRENKNRPMEISSKRPVSRFRQVVQVKKKISRDPRFDDLSGEYKEEYFKTAYSFLDDVKTKEKEKLQKLVKKTSDPQKKSEIQYLINRMKQQEQTTSMKQTSANIDRAWKKKEQELVKQGKQPFFLKKADRKKLELAEKYKELQKSGGVEKYLSKKRKKSAQKERKKLPT